MTGPVQGDVTAGSIIASGSSASANIAAVQVTRSKLTWRPCVVSICSPPHQALIMTAVTRADSSMGCFPGFVGVVSSFVGVSPFRIYTSWISTPFAASCQTLLASFQTADTWPHWIVFWTIFNGPTELSASIDVANWICPTASCGIWVYCDDSDMCCSAHMCSFLLRFPDSQLHGVSRTPLSVDEILEKEETFLVHRCKGRTLPSECLVMWHRVWDFPMRFWFGGIFCCLCLTLMVGFTFCFAWHIDEFRRELRLCFSDL